MPLKNINEDFERTQKILNRRVIIAAIALSSIFVYVMYMLYTEDPLLKNMMVFMAFSISEISIVIFIRLTLKRMERNISKALLGGKIKHLKYF